MKRLSALLLAISLQALDASAETLARDRVGDTYETRLESVTETTGEGSSGRSHDVTTLVERVIALRDDGVELEFDLPEEASAEDRARTWQLPARVLKPAVGPFRLLNGSELEERVQIWLALGGLTNEACGRWMFTWTAFKIECDPQSVLETLAPFDLRPSDLRDGSLHRDPGAREPQALRMESQSPDGATYVVELEVDPDAVRQARAETDVVVAQIVGQEPLTIEAAVEVWAPKPISGRITTTFETDTIGRVVRRTRVTEIQVTTENGTQEHQTTTETAERRFEGNRAEQ